MNKLWDKNILCFAEIWESYSTFKQNPIGKMQVLKLGIKDYENQNWWKSNEASSSFF